MHRSFQLVHWSQGGLTDLENLALLCDKHHDSVHHDGWDIELAADGRPELRPPPSIDPNRNPRRNRHWLIQTELHLR